MQPARVVMLLLLVAAVPAAGATPPSPDTDNTVTRDDVRADGDAQWSVAVRTRLDSQSDVETYRAFQDDVRSNTSRHLGPFRERLRGVVGTADAGTDRQMTARNFSVSTSIQQVPRQWGVLRFSFTWEEFARTDGEHVVVGDVFDSGLFLARNDTLVVEAPSEYTVENAAPSPDSRDEGTVSWIGPRDFADERPSVRFAPQSPSASESVGAAVGTTRAVQTLGAIGGVGLLAAVGYALYRRSDDEDETERGHAGGVVTDGDRVIRQLDANGGQMKQGDIAAELDWSASKTSRILSDLAEDGRVEKLRVGRENVIALPEERGD